jgi:hypothetical protein
MMVIATATARPSRKYLIAREASSAAFSPSIPVYQGIRKKKVACLVYFLRFKVWDAPHPRL